MSRRLVPGRFLQSAFRLESDLAGRRESINFAVATHASYIIIKLIDEMLQ
jgi:hypothetical protein